MLDDIEVDYLRPRPICKVTGEFWAQTTEGDGNFRMFSFLEGEGAEVLVEPVATWIAYMLNQATNKARDRRALDGGTVRARIGREVAFRRRMYSLGLADRIAYFLRRHRERLSDRRVALVSVDRQLVCMEEELRSGCVIHC